MGRRSSRRPMLEVSVPGSRLNPAPALRLRSSRRKSHVGSASRPRTSPEAGGRDGAPIPTLASIPSPGFRDAPATRPMNWRCRSERRPYRHGQNFPTAPRVPTVRAISSCTTTRSYALRAAWRGTSTPQSLRGGVNSFHRFARAIAQIAANTSFGDIKTLSTGGHLGNLVTTTVIWGARVRVPPC